MNNDLMLDELLSAWEETYKKRATDFLGIPCIKGKQQVCGRNKRICRKSIRRHNVLRRAKPLSEFKKVPTFEYCGLRQQESK